MCLAFFQLIANHSNERVKHRAVFLALTLDIKAEVNFEKN